MGVSPATGPQASAASPAAVSVTEPLVFDSLPTLVAQVGVPYRYEPVVGNAYGSELAFIVSNRPAWAYIDPQTGVLTGTPGLADVGASPGITISATATSTAGKRTGSIGPFTLKVLAAPTGAGSVATNHAPTLSGVASTLVTAGQSFVFQPSAADADGDALLFGIQNKPAWSSFDSRSGRLSGQPSAVDVGIDSNVVISVSDGSANAALTAFTITVVPAVTTGTATLLWIPPTQNTDGTALTMLAGYRVYYGSNPNSLTRTLDIIAPGLSAYVMSNLSSGTYFFAITALDRNGAESAQSNVGSKTIP